MASRAYNPALHRFAVFYAVCVFLLLIAGALVTSNDAGLAVPDWPTSFGSLYRIPPMVGGIKFEHGHRMWAEFCGLLTIIFAVWTQRRDPRSWMRKLGWLALILVIAQGVLGGLTVLNLLPWYISTAHAMLAQTFFCLTALFALFTSESWLDSEPLALSDSRAPSMRVMAVLAVSSVYMQLFLGAAFRHHGMHFLPHLIGAGVATVILIWASMRAILGSQRASAIRKPAIYIHMLVLLQLLLGFASYMTRIVWGRTAVQPMPSMVASTVAHVAVGALLLADCFVLAVQVFYNTQAAPEQVAERSAVTA